MLSAIHKMNWIFFCATVSFTSAMKLCHFSIFKQSLKAGVSSREKMASPNQMVRKVINLLSLSLSHTLTEHNWNLQEDRSERRMTNEQMTTARTVSKLCNSNKYIQELNINVCYRWGGQAPHQLLLILHTRVHTMIQERYTDTQYTHIFRVKFWARKAKSGSTQSHVLMLSLNTHTQTYTHLARFLPATPTCHSKRMWSQQQKQGDSVCVCVCMFGERRGTKRHRLKYHWWQCHLSLRALSLSPQMHFKASLSTSASGNETLGRP